MQIISRETANQATTSTRPPITSNNDAIVSSEAQSMPSEGQQWQTVDATKQRSNKKKKNKKPESDDSTEHVATELEKPRTTLLIWDSMVTNVQGRELRQVVGHRVVVRPFSGATTRAMKDNLKPDLEHEPSEVILHVDTNDLRFRKPEEVADSIVDLARQIKNSCNATVTISELVCRKG